LTVDHIVPVALGGDNTAENLTTACRDCNSGKSSVPPNAETVVEVNELADRFRLAFRKVTEFDRDEREKRMTTLDLMVCDFALEWAQLARDTGRRYALPNEARGSLIRFYDSGLDESDFFQAAFYMFHMSPKKADPWKYFCGICWGMIRDRTNKALDMIHEGGES